MEIHHPKKPSIEASDNIRRVQIEGLVVLKVVNHCHSQLPQMVTGELLGLDVDDTLEITSCFPFISRADEGNVRRTEQQEEEFDQATRDYQIEMMRQLREVNVDANTVGWYCSSFSESMLSLSIIETHFNYQSALGQRCVCLVYDPLRTTRGKLALRALRLREGFMRMYKEQDFTQETIKEKKLLADDIFEELPITIHNSSLISAFVAELALSKPFVESATAECTSELATTGYLIKSLEGVTEGIDDLWQSLQRYGQEQKRFKQFELYAKEGDRKPPKPSRLESILISKQLGNHCSFLEELAMDNFEHLYFADTLHKVSAGVDK